MHFQLKDCHSLLDVGVLLSLAEIQRTIHCIIFVDISNKNSFKTDATAIIKYTTTSNANKLTSSLLVQVQEFVPIN